ncbi:hypothetical protein PENSUB_5489 [Penicillium subrubescens]|uniref:Uncharacterized protein n=1 Tax=Penicillium subrubescens TaxID=1316194 RepID=A0A1Q5U8X0_9EURO|nr:hypothetical protein PENSUB_5489 [Penicillium subrubescens]
MAITRSSNGSGVESNIAPSVPSQIPQSDLRRKKGHGQCFTDDLDKAIVNLQAVARNIQALLTILKDKRSRELASMKDNSASEGKWELPLQNTFGSKIPTGDGQLQKRDKFYFSEPLSWATRIGSVCILVLAILSVDWSSFWKIPPSAAAIDMGEFSNLMRTWAGAAIKGLSQEFSAGQEA